MASSLKSNTKGGFSGRVDILVVCFEMGLSLLIRTERIIEVMGGPIVQE